MTFRITLILVLSWAFSAAHARQPMAHAGPKSEAAKVHSHGPIDRSGKKHKGKASFYARKFFGKTMADGTPMNPQSNVAASKTLPLGTKATVKNLRNGKSAVVEIKDRGPYVIGRIVDLSPQTAKKLDMEKDGVVPVEVVPIEIPQPNGSVKLSAAASETDKGEP